MAATSSPTGASSRRQVVYNGKPVEGLYTRLLADGRPRFEYISKRGGKRTKVTLAASTARQAIREAEGLRPLATDGKIGTGSVRLRDLCEQFFCEAESGEYAPRGRYAESTLELYRQRLDEHVLPLLGNRRVREIRKADAQAVADRLALRFAGSTVRGCVVALAALMRFAGSIEGSSTRTPSIASSCPRRSGGSSRAT